MNRTALALLFCVLSFVADAAFAQQVAQSPLVEYTVTLDQPQTQMVDISMLLRNVRGESVDFMLPVWRPGRYVVLNQAGTLRDVKAFGENNQPLAIEKTEKSTWRVETDGSRSIRVAYRVYANSLGDRTRHVDDTHAFLSGAAVFMYTAESRQEMCHVHINNPKEWKIASGLDPAESGADTLRAANYDVLVDSPLEIGLHDVIDFVAAGKPHQIVIWGKADYKADDLKRDFAKIVEEQTKIFGSAPYQRYVFIIHAGAGVGGGTEHINSTVMQVSRAALEEAEPYKRFFGLVSHEFFHTWNVKSFRPAGIHPYDYQRENYTPLLWVAEGTTTYYTPLALVRAGLTKPNAYLERLGEAIDAMRNKPGEGVQSVEQASFDSWIQFNAHTPDDVNSTVDFYAKGALVSLLIDLEMRRRSDNGANLDQVMRAMYERFPLDGPGYTSDDLQDIIEEISGADFDDIFERHVRGAQPLEFERAFEVVGVQVCFKPAKRDESDDDDDGEAGDDSPDQPPSEPQLTQPEAETQPDAPPVIKACLGVNLADAAGKTNVTSVLSDGPAYAAGVLAGDEVLALDGRRLTAASLNERLKHFKPDQIVTLTIFRHDQIRSVPITLTGKPDGKWMLRRIRQPTDAQKAAYESWLGQKWPDDANTETLKH